MFNVSSKESYFMSTTRSATRIEDFPTFPFPTAPFPTARPAYSQGVYLSLTITFIVIYALIFAAVYLQLVLILYFRHKRFSYQTGFLYLCLIWSLLRIVLFSFYFNNAKYANTLPFVFYFLLFCFPSFLQFCTLCLLVLFFGQVYFKVAKRYEMQRFKLILRVSLWIGIFIFLGSSIVCSYITRELCELNTIIKNCDVYKITVIRVVLTDSLFVIFGVLLGVYLYRLSRMPTFNAIMKQHGTSNVQAIIVTIFTSFLFITRTLYNILAISIDNKKLPDFGFDWINVSDQADLVNLTEVKKFVTFSIVLLIWEIIPTTVVVVIFRIKKNEVTDYNANVDSRARIPRRSVFADTGAGAINYSIDPIEEERESLLNNSIKSNGYKIESANASFYNSSNFSESYSQNYDGTAINYTSPLNFVNENFKFH